MTPQPSTSRTSNRESAGGVSARLKRLFSRENLPRSRAARITIGIVLTLGGFVGFLPILGFWMVPMGLAVLAIDIPAVRRFTRKTKVLLARFWHRIRH
jgi:hypothetical protein